MPFASKRQQRWAFANAAKLKAKGMDVHEWADKTDFKHLPEKAAAFPMIPHNALIWGDLAGLGILAEPTIHKWISGKEPSEHEKDIAEVGGLGVLAATQIPHLTGHVSEEPLFPHLRGGLPNPDGTPKLSAMLSGDAEQFHGEDVQQPLLRNPYETTDPQRAVEYENGYQHAMSLGHMGLQNYDPATSNEESIAWRQGLVDAMGKLGRRDLATQVKTADFHLHGQAVRIEQPESDVETPAPLDPGQKDVLVLGQVAGLTPRTATPKIAGLFSKPSWLPKLTAAFKPATEAEKALRRVRMNGPVYAHDPKELAFGSALADLSKNDPEMFKTVSSQMAMKGRVNTRQHLLQGTDKHPGFPNQLTLEDVGVKLSCVEGNVMSLSEDPGHLDKAPGILFDIDGTIVDDAAWMGPPEQQTMLPGMLEKLMALHGTGLRMAAVTNRSVYDDSKTLQDVAASNAHVHKMCGGTIRDIYFMSHGPTEHHKPAATMLHIAMAREGIDPTNCMYVGNSDDDAAAAQNAGIPFVHISEFLGSP